MVKLLDDSIGTYENILVALTFLGVLYLVMKQANLSVSLSKDGFGNQSASVLGFDVISDSTTAGSYTPYGKRGLEGFSDGAMEAPVFHTTPYLLSDFNPVEYEKSSALSEYGSMLQANWAENRPAFINNYKNGSGTATAFDAEIIPSAGGNGYVNNPSSEGARDRYVKRQGMMDGKLLGAAAGLGVRL